jgi:hypothetical protein
LLVIPGAVAPPPKKGKAGKAAKAGKGKGAKTYKLADHSGREGFGEIRLSLATSKSTTEDRGWIPVENLGKQAPSPTKRSRAEQACCVST